MRSTLLGPYSRQQARIATAWVLAFQWIIVVSGATVRLTGSGLGCPNWPTCTTSRAVPELSFHPMVEWINRMMATPVLITALIALWMCWRLADGPRRDLRVAMSIVVVGIGLQAAVGMLVVLYELPPELVSLHFLLSVLVIPAAVYAWHGTQRSNGAYDHTARGRARRLAAFTMLALLLMVIVAGVLTTASGPHSGASGTGQHVDRLGILGIAVTFHARLAFAFLALVAVLTWRRVRRATALRDLAALLVMTACQIALGEIQFRNGLPWQIVLPHVALATAMWVVASRIAIDSVWPVDAAGDDDLLQPAGVTGAADASDRLHA